MKQIRKKKYTKENLSQVKGQVLNNLTNVTGGLLIPGCCTQGCCEIEDVLDF